MSADATTVSAVSTAAGGLKDTVLGIGSAVLPYGATLLALTVGWRFARKFVKG